MKKVFIIALLILLCFITACRSSYVYTIDRALKASTPPSSLTTIISSDISIPPALTPEPSLKTLSGSEPVPFSVYAPTVNMSFEELVGDDGYYEYPKGFPAKDTYRITVDIYHQVVMVYSKDGNGKYTVPVRYMLCSTGKDNRTPIGTFKMQRYHVRFSIFANDGRYGQYWSQIKGRIYFHTILYSKKDSSSYDLKTYNKLGTPDSHGCIRLTAPDARWIYYNIAPDTKVVIRKGSKNDTETALIRSQLILAPAPDERVKIKKGKVPYTDNWKISEVLSEVRFRQGSQS